MYSIVRPGHCLRMILINLANASLMPTAHLSGEVQRDGFAVNVMNFSGFPRFPLRITRDLLIGWQIGQDHRLHVRIAACPPV